MYGTCNLSIVPVRTEPSDRSELCTQLLFGETYSILELHENEKWIKIRLVEDDYEGWIDAKQHNEVTEAFFNACLLHQHGVSYDDVALIETTDEHFLIPLGCSLPFLQNRNFRIGNKSYTYQGDLVEQPTTITTEIIRFFAMRYLHAPYLWGGKTLFGTDCSGYVQTFFRLLGYKMKRDAWQQAEQGTIVKHVYETLPGDLAFFGNQAGKVIHGGILLEDSYIIHAHGKVRIDLLDETGIINLTSKKYSHNLTSIKRIIV